MHPFTGPPEEIWLERYKRGYESNVNVPKLREYQSEETTSIRACG